MQTEIVGGLSKFRSFQVDFDHFFDSCEQGFKNDLLINLYCRIFPRSDNVTLVMIGKTFRELMFIEQGCVGLFLDSQANEDPFLIMPRSAYIGDYQILYDLKAIFELRCFYPTKDQMRLV